MTISNHITLADIHRMPVGQIAALPADQLALLKGAADEQLTQAKSVADWLDGAISLKYADRAQDTRQEAGKDTALTSLPIAEANLGIPWNLRIGPASRPVSDETYVAQSFTPAGVGLRPFSVAHVEQPWRSPRTPGDLTLHWTRRSCALAADSWGGLEVPLAEELEAYEVEILDGATVKRVLSTATNNAVYPIHGP